MRFWLLHEIASKNFDGYVERDIEGESLRLIDRFIDKSLPDDKRLIISKLVHSVADLSIIPDIRISDGFVNTFIKALKSEVPIVCDSEMTKAGIYSKNVISRSQIYTFLRDIKTIEFAKKTGMTKSAAAIHIAVETLGENCVFVIGNSPTSLRELVSLWEKHIVNPIAVVGCPVGFVNATLSKYELIKTNLEYVTVLGRRGGSPMAASVVNAIGMMY
ncbi:MAG: precorrin-8X methylmutase [Thermoplasmatales archaeon]